MNLAMITPKLAPPLIVPFSSDICQAVLSLTNTFVVRHFNGNSRLAFYYLLHEGHLHAKLQEEGSSLML